MAMKCGEMSSSKMRMNQRRKPVSVRLFFSALAQASWCGRIKKQALIDANICPRGNSRSRSEVFSMSKLSARELSNGPDIALSRDAGRL
jgi:hypothetical protein